MSGPRVPTGENSQILTMSNKNSYSNLRAPKIFCMQLVISKVSFFLLGRFAANFPSHKKSTYFTHFTHLLHK
jgi:hypothetical protein